MTRCSCDGVFAANTNSVEEERPNVADDPSVLSNSPRRRQHEETDKHDGGVLYEAPSPTDPISNEADGDLAFGRLAVKAAVGCGREATNDDSDDFEIFDSC